MRRSLLASLVATSMLIALPSGVSAATQIGETFPPTTAQCGTDNTLLQTGSPNSQYAAPSAGVITSWSFRAGSEVPNNLKLKVGRSAGGNLFMIVGESPPKNPTADMLNTFTDVRIPVQAGDVIGYYSGTQVGYCGGGTSPEYLFRFRDGDQSPGTTEPYGAEDFFFQINFSALLEPDCDKDGLGDESQDKDIASCTATCRGKKATIAGTNGPDNIVGTSARDVIAALAGADTASGLGGNDLICGGTGKDKLRGGPGNDFLSGQKGKDKLVGQKGKDKLSGKKGKDVCVGGAGTDKAKGCERTKSI